LRQIDTGSDVRGPWAASERLVVRAFSQKSGVDAGSRPILLWGMAVLAVRKIRNSSRQHPPPSAIRHRTVRDNVTGTKFLVGVSAREACPWESLVISQSIQHGRERGRPRRLRLRRRWSRPQGSRTGGATRRTTMGAWMKGARVSNGSSAVRNRQMVLGFLRS